MNFNNKDSFALPKLQWFLTFVLPRLPQLSSVLSTSDFK